MQWREKTYPEYAYYSAGKWLYYPERVALVRDRCFRQVRPVTAQLIPTLYCNFSCPRCSYGGSKLHLMQTHDRTDLNMDWPTMRSLLDGLHQGGVRGIVFTGGGEPFVNPHLLQGMRYVREQGLSVGLFTNGSLLTPELMDGLLALTPAFLRLSLDAGSSLTHRLIHGYSQREQHFQRILDSLSYLAKAKVQRSSPTTVGVGVSVEPVNLDDLVTIAELLRHIVDLPPAGGIDYLVFRPVVNYHCGGFNQQTAPVLKFLNQVHPEYVNAYQRFIFQGDQFPGRLFTEASRIIDSEVRRILAGSTVDVINIRSKMTGVAANVRPFSKCRASPWYIFVGPDGSVYNCVELGLEPRVIIGNLLEETLDEIWQGRRRQEVLDYMDTKGLQELCPPICLYYEMNTLFEEIDSELKEGSTAVGQWLEGESQRARAEIEGENVTQPHIEFI